MPVESLVPAELLPDELTASEQLVKRAESGEKLTTEERRQAIAYIMAVSNTSNADMSRMFGVSEGMIRKDKDIIRKNSAEEITKDDVGLVVADIRRTYDRFQQEIDLCLKKAVRGSTTYLAYLKAMMDYQLKVVESLQSLGYYPKNLGSMTQTRYTFKSHVNIKDGSVTTVAAKPEEVQADIVAHAEHSSIQDAEFEDIPNSPLSQHDRKLLSSFTGDTDEDRSTRLSLAEEFADTPRPSNTLTDDSDDGADSEG
jgi:uncharacterized protein YutE (UPF0331/DUF86 family)